MSCYCKQKVLRIPQSKINMNTLVEILQEKIENYEYDEYEFFNELEIILPDLFAYGKTDKFQRAPTEENFIDYVLQYEYDACEGEYGKIRELYESEKQKYLPIFQKLDKNVSMDDVHLVEYCYYNGTEAPDYYQLENDPLYLEV